MTEENKELRDALVDVEHLIVGCLRTQPHGDAECGIHLRKCAAEAARRLRAALGDDRGTQA